MTLKLPNRIEKNQNYQTFLSNPAINKHQVLLDSLKCVG
jgi:hypothetical protein